MKNKILSAALILSAFFAVMAWHFGEVAKTPAAWTMWDIIGGLSIVAFPAIIVYMAKTKSK